MFHVPSQFIKLKAEAAVMLRKNKKITILPLTPICIPYNFMANRRVPKFSLDNCPQSLKKTFMCPKFHTNPVLKYTKCHISTNLSSFLKLCLLYCQKYLPLLQQIADSLKKIGSVGTLTPTLNPTPTQTQNRTQTLTII